MRSPTKICVDLERLEVKVSGDEGEVSASGSSVLGLTPEELGVAGQPIAVILSRLGVAIVNQEAPGARCRLTVAAYDAASGAVLPVNVSVERPGRSPWVGIASDGQATLETPFRTMASVTFTAEGYAPYRVEMPLMGTRSISVRLEPIDPPKVNFDWAEVEFLDLERHILHRHCCASADKLEEAKNGLSMAIHVARQAIERAKTAEAILRTSEEGAQGEVVNAYLPPIKVVGRGGDA